MSEFSDALLQTHADARPLPFSCSMPGCDYRSAWKTNIDAHAATHTGAKPFSCRVDGCDYHTATKSNLKAHEEAHAGRGYACKHDGCSESFTRKYNLITHTRVQHTDDARPICVKSKGVPRGSARRRSYGFARAPTPPETICLYMPPAFCNTWSTTQARGQALLRGQLQKCHRARGDRHSAASTCSPPRDRCL